MTEFKPGDRVRVTLEGEVRDTLPGGKLTLRYDGEYLFVQPPEKVEKIEPPVEAFKPGDFVREKSTDRVFYAATDGYVQVLPTAGSFWRYGPTGLAGSLPHDTGEYERVTLVEPPL